MKILYITTIAATMEFFKEQFEEYNELNYEVEIACNTSIPSTFDSKQYNLKVHNIPFSRKPFSTDNIKALIALKKLIDSNHYDIVHCHTPNAAAITRLVCRKIRKTGTRVMYTAHGFHFYKGAPLKNWLVYFPVEWICAHWTDVLITINHEDYALAKKIFAAKKVEYIPGMGIHTSLFNVNDKKRIEKRKELGLNEHSIAILSVGEVNKNKNHKLILESISKLKNKNIHYFIAGVGSERDNLLNMAQKYGVDENFHLLGYRNDIAELDAAADFFAFPSKREGLGLAAIEAMATGTPVMGMNTRGISEYVINGKTGILFENKVETVVAALNYLIQLPNAELMGMKKRCKEMAKKYDCCETKRVLDRIYGIRSTNG